MKKILFILTFILTFGLFSCEKKEENNEFTYEIKEYNGPAVTRIYTEHYVDETGLLVEDYKSIDYGPTQKLPIPQKYMLDIDFINCSIEEGFKDYGEKDYIMVDVSSFSSDLIKSSMDKLYSLKFFDLANSADKLYEKYYIPKTVIEFEDNTKIEYNAIDLLISRRVIKEINKVFEELIGSGLYDIFISPLMFNYSKIYTTGFYDFSLDIERQIEKCSPSLKASLKNEYNESNLLEYIKNSRIIEIPFNDKFTYDDIIFSIDLSIKFKRIVIKSYNSDLSDELLIYDGENRFVDLAIKEAEEVYKLELDRVYHIRFELEDGQYLDYGFNLISKNLI